MHYNPYPLLIRTIYSYMYTMACPPVHGDNPWALARWYRWTDIVYLLDTTFISVDLADFTDFWETL